MSFADNVDATIVAGQAASNTANTGNPVKAGAVYNATPPTVTSGNVIDLQTDANANLMVNVANGVTSGTAGSPSAGVLSIQGLANMTPVLTTQGLQTSGGANYYNAIAPATPTLQTVKSGTGNLYQVVAFNFGAAPVFIKFFDVAGSVTLGSTAATFQFIVPGNTSGTGFNVTLSGLRTFANSIRYAITGGIALTDNTTITANVVVADISYY